MLTKDTSTSMKINPVSLYSQGKSGWYILWSPELFISFSNIPLNQVIWSMPRKCLVLSPNCKEDQSRSVQLKMSKMHRNAWNLLKLIILYFLFFNVSDAKRRYPYSLTYCKGHYLENSGFLIFWGFFLLENHNSYFSLFDFTNQITSKMMCCYNNKNPF